ncbi:MAG: InlB B-repeat-containing protein [Oscillospiraceae bacterium]|jgi:hypothetical protein|nr:InlB B-repeat-containing protein [Oscillospiraceae bacterium]
MNKTQKTKRGLSLIVALLLLINLIVPGTAVLAAQSELALSLTAATNTIAPGEEVVITVELQNYSGGDMADILGLQVDVLLDTTLVDFVASSATVVATANSGDLINAGYNSTNKKVIFQYVSMNSASTPLSRSNNKLFTFKVKAKDSITTSQTAVFSVTQFAVSDATGNRKINGTNNLSVAIQSAPVAELALELSSSKASIAPGETAEISVKLNNYAANTADILGLQVDMLLDTTLVDFVASSATVVAEGNSGDLINAGYNATNKKVIFQYVSMNSASTPFSHDNTTLFTFEVKAKESITEEQTAVFSVTQFAVSDATGNRKITGTQSLSLPITVEAEPLPTSAQIVVSSQKGVAADTVDVDISIANNPGVFSFVANINYDVTRLKLIGVTNGSVLSGPQHNVNNLAQNPYKLTFCNPLATEDNTANGTIATLQFEVLADAPLGDAAITATLDEENTFNSNFEPTDFATVNGKIAVVNKYTVTFKDWNGTTLKTQEVLDGDAATAPANPSRVGYNFTGWNTTFNNITSNLTVAAQYTIKTYTVTFRGYNNVTLSSQTIEHGSAATAPLAPDVDGYVFVGWNGAYANITENVTVTANYVLYEDAPKIIVSSGSAYVGKTIDVTVSLENSFGVISLMTAVAYDATQLELISVSNGTVLNGATHNTGNLSSNPYNIVFVDALASQNNTDNGVLVTLTFNVLQTAVDGTTPITVTYQKENTLNAAGQEVFFLPVSGTIAISTRNPGDVNDDGRVNMQDYIRLVRYLSGGWPDATVIHEANSDVTGDGRVNMQDYIRLVRYLAGGWPDATELL